MRFDEEWVAARATEDGDCLLWSLMVSCTGRPIYKPLEPDGSRPTVQVSRKVWESRRGPIPKGRCVTFTCGNPRCLEHLELVTKAELIRRMWQRQDIRLRKVAAVTRTGRERAKLNMEKARYIRSSPATLQKVAQELGISFQLASKVRRGQAWKEPNPFAGLGG